jgi:hypothetical protein
MTDEAIERVAREFWGDATNAVCQTLQDASMCKCPDGKCVAANVDPSAASLRWFRAALSAACPEGQWQPIETYPRCTTCLDQNCDWGPEALVLVPPVTVDGFEMGPTRYVAHKEAGMWLTRGGSEPYTWDGLPELPSHWMPLPASPSPIPSPTGEEPKPPEGYTKLPAGVRCKCIRSWKYGDEYWCCNGAPIAGEGAAAGEKKPLRCLDCGLLYSDSRWADFVVSDEAWRLICPEDKGVLCVTCMIGRAAAISLETEGSFTSGPFANHNWRKPDGTGRASPAAGEVERLRSEAEELIRDYDYRPSQWNTNAIINFVRGRALTSPAEQEGE